MRRSWNTRIPLQVLKHSTSRSWDWLPNIWSYISFFFFLNILTSNKFNSDGNLSGPSITYFTWNSIELNFTVEIYLFIRFHAVKRKDAGLSTDFRDEFSILHWLSVSNCSFSGTWRVVLTWCGSKRGLQRDVKRARLFYLQFF